ncbi:MAG: hypothetical protein FWH51_06330, partial [Dehalococcoidia bacterium]|nr:hypothetical protein [Dehalococcoidia bacterium]
MLEIKIRTFYPVLSIVLTLALVLGTFVAFAPGQQRATYAAPGDPTLVVTSSGNSGPGTLRDILANFAENGDVITFSPDITSITLESTIYFSQENLTIDGGAGVTITKNSVAIFRLLNSSAEGGLLTLKGLTMSNGNVASDDGSGYGGGVYVGSEDYGGNIALINCTFIGNKADLGGGVFTWGSVVLSNCTFLNNNAEAGGGVYALDTATLSNCTFVGNEAGNSGGGVYADVYAELANCTFIGNTANFGGGVFTYYYCPKLDSCVFAYNTATFGIVYSYANFATPLLIANNSSFFANTLTNNAYPTGVLDSYAGATIYHCSFAGNIKAGTNSAYNIYIEVPSLTIENCLMTLDGLDGHSNMSFGGDNLLGTGT